MRRLLTSVAIALGAASTTLGQDAAPGADLDPFQEFRQNLVGDYVGEQHTLHIAAVNAPPFDRPLYVELVRKGFELEPDRQQLWWFYERNGETFIRVMSFTKRVGAMFSTNLGDIAIGTWAAPQFYPQIKSDQYDALGDMRVEMADGGVHLESTAPFPIAFGGAFETTATISVNADTASWLEIGRDMHGDIVWGDPAEPIYMNRVQDFPKGVQLESGTWIVDLRVGEPLGVGNMDQVEDGDSIAMHWRAFLATGVLWEDTRLPDRSIYTGGFPINAFPGMNDGIRGMRAPNFQLQMEPFVGTIRRAFIPPSRAFGQRGNPPFIPPNASLIMDFEIESIKSDALNVEQPNR